MLRIRKAIVAGIVLAGGLASFGFAGSANAAQYGDYISNDVYIRSGPSTSYRADGQGYVGDGIYATCSQWGQNINGNSWWDYHRNLRTNVSGYSADYYTSINPLTLPDCY